MDYLQDGIIDQNEMKEIIAHIESDQNKGRKAEIYKQAEIYNNRIRQYVVAELRGQFDEATIREMPVVASVNVARRVINKVASIYNEAPDRDYTLLSDDQKEIAWRVYHDMEVNKKLRMANIYFKLHKQCLLWIIPKGGKLIVRILRPSQWDVIVDHRDPEVAKGYIISSYDDYYELLEASDPPGTATGQRTISSQSTENYKQDLAFKQQSNQKNKKYLVWTKQANYFVNADGERIGEVMPNPLEDTLPFIEVSDEKEFEYWVRQASLETDFTVDFNTRMSEVAQVVKMQGFAQAYMKGPKDVLIESQRVGPNYILKLPNDPQAGIETEFGFAQPGSDIQGSISYLETHLSSFLSCFGLDPSTVSLKGDSSKFNSGLERLLAMIETMSASRSDYDLFQRAETMIWELVVKWQNALSNTSTLDDKYKIGAISDDAQVVVKFSMPEMIKTDSDQLDIYQREMDMGITSPIKVIMEREDVSREEAEKLYAQYQKDMMGFVTEPKEETETEEV